MKLTWGKRSWKRLLSRVNAKASRYDAFDVTATREHYERLKLELTNAVVGEVFMDDGDGWVDFAIAKTEDSLAKHELAR